MLSGPLIAEQDIALVTFEYKSLNVSEKLVASSKVLSIVPTADFGKISHMEFVSKRAAKQFALRAAAERVLAVQSVLRELLSNNAMRAGYVGFAFEGYFLRLFMSGSLGRSKALVCHNLDQGKAFLLRSCSTKEFDALSNLSRTATPTLFVPAKSNFATFDAFLVSGDDVTALQVTLASSHAPKQFGMFEIKQHLDKAKLTLKRIVWVTDVGSNLQGKQSLGEKPTASQVNAVIKSDKKKTSKDEAEAKIHAEAQALLTGAVQYRVMVPVGVASVVHCRVDSDDVELLLGESTPAGVQTEIEKSKLFADTAKVQLRSDLRDSEGALNYIIV
jgi:hypothetical protein